MNKIFKTCLRGIVSGIISVFSFIVKLFPSWWFRFTKITNPLAFYFLPSVERQVSMALTLDGVDYRSHEWSDETNKRVYALSWKRIGICNSAEFQILRDAPMGHLKEFLTETNEYTLSQKEILDIVSTRRECIAPLMRRQPQTFTAAVVKKICEIYGRDDVNSFVASFPTEHVTWEIMTVIFSFWKKVTESTFQSFVTENIDKIPSFKIAGLLAKHEDLNLENHADLQRQWIKSHSAMQVWLAWGTEWLSNGDRYAIDTLVVKAISEKNQDALIEIIKASPARLENIAQECVRKKFPAPKLLNRPNWNNRALQNKLVEVCLVPQAVKEIPVQYAMHYLDEAQQKKYILLMTEVDALSHQIYETLEGTLKEEVEAIQKSNAEIAWLRSTPINLNTFTHRVLLARTQMWMLHNMRRDLMDYAEEHNLSDEVLKKLADEGEKVFLKSYLMKKGLTNLPVQIKDYILFSPVKEILV